MRKSAGNKGGAQFALAVAGTAVTLTVPSGATNAIIDNSGGGVIRYTTDGSTPSATAGNRLAVGASLNWSDPSIDFSSLLTALKMIRENSNASSTVEVQYYTYG